MRLAAACYRILRRWWVVLALGIAAALLVRFFLISGYAIPTGSMEPCLHGDRANGDRVAVFKLHYRLFEPERFDMVVFESESGGSGADGGAAGGPTTMVKRVAGFPGERVRIDGGDLFVGGERVCKPLPLVRDLLIPVYRARLDAGFFDDWVCYRIEENDLRLDPEAMRVCWSLSGGHLICNGAHPDLEGEAATLTFAAEIADSYLDDDGRFHPGACAVGDVALGLECEILDEGTGTVCCELHEGTDSFRFELATRSAGGGGRILHRHGDPAVRPIGADRFPGLVPGQVAAIECLNVDNRIALLCDGVLLAEIAFEETSAFVATALYNSPGFGATGVKAAFHAVRIDRDIHYIDTGGIGCGKEGFTVPEGSYFFLGDNSSESWDSRMMGAVEGDRIVGKPFFVFYPLKRVRFL